MQFRLVLLEQFKEPDTQLLAPLARPDPDSVEVSIVANILRYCNGQIKVEDGMPPVAWDEHGLSRVLDALDPIGDLPSAFRPFALLESRQDEVKVLDRFIVLFFLHQVLSSH